MTVLLLGQSGQSHSKSESKNSLCAAQWGFGCLQGQRSQHLSALAHSLTFMVKMLFAV